MCKHVYRSTLFVFLYVYFHTNRKKIESCQRWLCLLTKKKKLTSGIYTSKLSQSVEFTSVTFFVCIRSLNVFFMYFCLFDTNFIALIFRARYGCYTTKGGGNFDGCKAKFDLTDQYIFYVMNERRGNHSRFLPPPHYICALQVF